MLLFWVELSCFYDCLLHDCWLELDHLTSTNIPFSCKVKSSSSGCWKLLTFTTVCWLFTLKSLPNLRDGVRSVFLLIRFYSSRVLQFFFARFYPHLHFCLKSYCFLDVLYDCVDLLISLDSIPVNLKFFCSSSCFLITNIPTISHKLIKDNIF